MSDHAPEPQHEQIVPGSIKPRRWPQGVNPKPGFLESGWGTAIFLSAGLMLLVSLVAGGMWIYTKISNSMREADKLAELRLPRQLPVPQPHDKPPALPNLRQQPRQDRKEISPVFPRLQSRRSSLDPSQLTAEVRDRIFRSLRTLEDDESRSKDIREGFSIEKMPKTEDERLERRNLRKLIESFITNDEEGIGAEIQLENLDRPAMLTRVRLLLPAELASQQALTLPNKYLPVLFQGVRVVSFKDVSDPLGDVRIVYCQMGPHIVKPYRIYLLKVGNDWKLFDFESVDYGLSFCEVVSMYYTINAFDRKRFETIDGRLVMASKINQTIDGTPFFSQYRKEIFPLVPQPLRDYLACSITAQLAFRPSAKQFRIDTLRKVEFPRRFGLEHEALCRSAQSDSRWEDAIEHSLAYINLFGNASPVVQVDAAMAYFKLSRIDDSRAMWRQVLTAAPKSNYAIMVIGESIETQKWSSELDPLIEEFQLRDLITEWQMSYREKYGKPQQSQSPENKPEAPATQPTPPQE